MRGGEFAHFKMRFSCAEVFTWLCVHLKCVMIFPGSYRFESYPDSSEHNFQRQLNLSRSGCSGRDEFCGWADPSIRKNDRVGCPEVCVVERVEDLRSELHVHFLGYRQTLHQ